MLRIGLANLGHFPGRLVLNLFLSSAMRIEEASKLIKVCAERMNALYGNPVFDEWVVVCMDKAKPRIASYSGPREAEFERGFETDYAALSAELQATKHNAGDFEFACHATGTHFDAFMMLGPEFFLVCNNTAQSMHDIAQNPRWLTAQVPFAQLADKFRNNELFAF